MRLEALKLKLKNKLKEGDTFRGAKIKVKDYSIKEDRDL